MYIFPQDNIVFLSTCHAIRIIVLWVENHSLLVDYISFEKVIRQKLNCQGKFAVGPVYRRMVDGE
jgi:hypothetical protein